MRTEVDEDACILPYEMSRIDEVGVVKGTEDFPQFQVSLRNKFCYIPNDNAFSAVSQDEGRLIRGCCLMGFGDDPQRVLQLAAGDLREMGCGLYLSGVQNIDTVESIVFLGVPHQIEAEVVEEKMITELVRLERRLVLEEPD